MNRVRTTVQWLVGALLACSLMHSHAQTLDDVTVDTSGTEVVAHLSFTSPVRLIQVRPAVAADNFQVAFELLGASDAALRQTVEETRRIAPTGTMPEATIVYVPNPNSRSKQLNIQLRAKAVVQARQGRNSKTIDLIFSPAPGGALDKHFAIILQRVPVSEPDKILPIPNRLQSFDVFSTDSTSDDNIPMIDVNVGYFATEEEAEAVRRAVLDRFPNAVVVDLSKRRLGTRRPKGAPEPPIAVAPPPAAPVPAPSAAAPVAAAPAQTGCTTVASPDIEARAADLMARARAALADKKYDQAIDALNQLLLLPPNCLSQEAQELIGLAYERAGDNRRARTEYELYLKLYPEGEGAQRVTQRLASLEGGAGAPTLETATAPSTAPKKYTGSIAQYYYGGRARSQSLVNLPAGIDQSTLTKTTESALVTSVDLGARFASAESETRLVFRGTGSANLASSSHATSLLNAAYIDYKRTGSGLAVRVGRQSAISGGLLGLFDGVSVTYPIREGLKVDVMGGVPANLLVSAPAERLLAGMIEFDGILEHWGGNVYIVDQTTEGITNRRAVGAEVRYSGERGSMYLLTDYDTLFRAVNAVSLQGSTQLPGQTTVTILLDSRKAPSLQLTNALISSGFTSLKTMLQLQTLDQVTDAARMTTAQAKQGLISVSRPLSEKWQLAGDLRYSEIGALPAVGDFEATPATGAQYGVSLQVTGSNLYSPRDINNFNLSLLSSPFLKGTQLSYSNLTGLRNNDLTLEPSLRLYIQKDNADVKLYRITPGFRASYRLSPRASVLGESIVEHSRTNGPTNHDTTNSVFFYLGYRYELF